MKARTLGFSLLEVMVAAFVLAIGMLGLSLLVTQSIRFNQVSAVHSQATLLAQSMMDRMASNVQGAWLGAYDGEFDAGAGFLTSACTSAACTPAELAARDTAQWTAELAQLLPAGASASVSCEALAAVDPGRLPANPIYSGACLLTLTWQEHDVEGAANAPASLAWRFRP